MLTDRMLEEEFRGNEEELWFSRTELQHDLHLAAELGKSLLERNHELEQGLQQIYSTNQEQLQEIEYLNKQVELLRQVNEQHVKMYEQLDGAARDVEQKNLTLVQENRTAQNKIHSLTDTIDSLQSHMEALQVQLEELKVAESERCRKEHAKSHRHRLSSQSISCLKELYDLQQDTRLSARCVDVGRLLTPSVVRFEEERSSLRSSLRNLHSQLARERERREAAERVMELTTQENRELEQQMALLEGARRQQVELEVEVEQLREMWRTESSSGQHSAVHLLDAVFFCSSEKGVESEPVEEAEGPALELRRGHMPTCIRRSEGIRQRGVSLLNEVDAQYGVLKGKYEELLRRCHGNHDLTLSHKGVQTPTAPSHALRETGTPGEEAYQPEYRALFKELFTRIQRTKEVLKKNRNQGPEPSAHAPVICDYANEGAGPHTLTREV